MLSSCWLASVALPLSRAALAVVPTTGAAAGVPQAATQGGGGPGGAGGAGATLADSLIFGGLIAWFVFAIVALIKWGVFSAKPLRTVPPRTSTGLLPVAFGMVILYIAFVGIAMNVAVSLRLFPSESIGIKPDADATAPVMTTETQPATAPVETLDPEAAQRRSNEQMRIQTVDAASKLAACVLALFLAQTLTVGGLKGLGLAPEQFPRGLAWGFIAYLLIFPILTLDNIIVSQIYSRFGHEPTVPETVQEIERTADLNVRLIFALVAGLGAPIAEEFLFRGLLQTALIQKGWGFLIKFPPDRGYVPPVYQRWGAILICSTLFSLLHSLDHMPILFLLSVGLGYLYERTGNLWASIVLHAAFNWWTLALLLIYGR